MNSTNYILTHFNIISGLFACKLRSLTVIGAAPSSKSRLLYQQTCPRYRSQFASSYQHNFYIFMKVNPRALLQRIFWLAETNFCCPKSGQGAGSGRRKWSKMAADEFNFYRDDRIFALYSLNSPSRMKSKVRLILINIPKAVLKVSAKYDDCRRYSE